MGRDFDLMGDRVSVVTYAGTVQVLFLTDGWPGGAREVVANRFASRATAAELRAIADHLDGLPWVDEGAVAGAGDVRERPAKGPVAGVSA
ncbi:hypothetical protein [Paragemmobacter ruber]|uniref:DUF982 domain-containing protein n=1 Tax=Paragemmobacter ruber TaxID=1985673 RepID=A0ABW9Y1D9_9RHOB|nr:hypothetical protein [Rhodobacter ruber]NBE05951.1 hypothetical protein [Rhodobacter ruber]